MLASDHAPSSIKTTKLIILSHSVEKVAYKNMYATRKKKMHDVIPFIHVEKIET